MSACHPQAYMADGLIHVSSDPKRTFREPAIEPNHCPLVITLDGIAERRDTGTGLSAALQAVLLSIVEMDRGGRQPLDVLS